MRKYVKGLVCGMLVLSLAMPMGAAPEMVKLSNVYAADANIEASVQLIEGKCGDNAKYSYNKDTKTLTISGAGEMWDEVRFPKEISNTENIVIENGITVIGEKSFSKQIEDIENLKIADTVTTIKKEAFPTVRGTVEIPASVTSVERYAFFRADKYVVKGDMKGYEYDALGWTAYELVLCGSADDLGKVAGDNTFDVITIAKYNDKCTVKNGCILSKDKKQLYYVMKSVCIGEKMIVPDTVEKICDGAFSNLDIKKVVLNEGLKEIGERAFKCTQLTKIKFPKSLKKIGAEAFSYTKIKKAELNGNVKMGNNAFDIDTVIYNKAGMKKSVTSIIRSDMTSKNCYVYFNKVNGAAGYQIQMKAGKKTYKFNTTTNKYKKTLDKNIKKYYKSVADIYEDDLSAAITVTVRPYKIVKGKKVYGKKSNSVVLRKK